MIILGWHLPARKIVSAQGWPSMPPARPHQALDTSRGETLTGESQSSQPMALGPRGFCCRRLLPHALSPGVCSVITTLCSSGGITQDGWRFARGGVGFRAGAVRLAEALPFLPVRLLHPGHSCLEGQS